MTGVNKVYNYMKNHFYNTGHDNGRENCSVQSYPDLNVSRYDGKIPIQEEGNLFRSDAYAIVLILKGKILLTNESRLQLIREKDLLFIFPNSAYHASAPEGVTFVRIDFKKEYLKEQGVFLSITHTHQLFTDHPLSKFSLTRIEFRDIYSDVLALEKKMKISGKIPYAHDIVRNSFAAILYDLFLINNARSAYHPLKHDSRIELTARFLTLLEQNFKVSKRVNYYASLMCITPRHLSQVVKQITDKTAGQHIDEIVIREAKLLLTSHSMNISEVAQHLFFADSSLFGKYFKKQTGQSPSAYKLKTYIAI